MSRFSKPWGLVPRLLLALLVIPLSSCLGTPDGVTPVANFDADRYLGRWYEIARLDHRFERGLINVSAHYTRRDDGAIRVLNRGFDVQENEWDEAEGVARFVEDDTRGYLKVSFFGPFYGSYVVFELDEHYQHAFVSGPNRGYLWLLARETAVSPPVRAKFLRLSRELGFDTDDLIWVEHPER